MRGRMRRGEEEEEEEEEEEAAAAERSRRWRRPWPWWVMGRSAGCMWRARGGAGGGYTTLRIAKRSLDSSKARAMGQPAPPPLALDHAPCPRSRLLLGLLHTTAAAVQARARGRLTPTPRDS